MVKDKAYAQLFSAGATTLAKSVPLVTHSRWGIRDCLVIGISFVFPPIVQVKLVGEFNFNEGVAKVSVFSILLIGVIISIVGENRYSTAGILLRLSPTINSQVFNQRIEKLTLLYSFLLLLLIISDYYAICMPDC